MEGETTRPIHATTITTTRDHFATMNGWKQYRHDYLGRRPTRTCFFIALVIFSPIILPLFCVCFPFICLIAVLLHLVPVKWRFQWGRGDRDRIGLNMRCKETTGEARAGLLERYLDDQLGLVVDASFGSMDRL